MPYRRLPKTDQARLRTLRTAIEKNIQGGIFMNVLSYNTYHKAKTFVERFSREVELYRQCLQQQTSKRGNVKYDTALKRARMYISHFIQVLSMSVVRGEIARSKRCYYGLQPDEDTLPNLSTETAVLEWGVRIIEGEKRRLAEGGIPIYNPTMGRMSVEYELFKDMYSQRQALQRQTSETLHNIAQMRPECDELILEVWEQIEQSFAGYTAGERFEKCAEFGVIYYTRTDRKKKSVTSQDE